MYKPYEVGASQYKPVLEANLYKPHVLGSNQHKPPVAGVDQCNPPIVELMYISSLYKELIRMSPVVWTGLFKPSIVRADLLKYVEAAAGLYMSPIV